MTTGSKIVDAMANVNITGNVISPMWYKTIKKEDGKPHFLAILILGDIVYWYRPQFIRDETTCSVVKVAKRFKDDLLQRSSKALAEQFGVSKRQVTEAMRVLEKLGVIKREFRNFSVNYGDEDVKFTNVQYISLNVKVLKKLSEVLEVNEKMSEGSAEKCDPHANLQEGDTQNCTTGIRKITYPPYAKLPDPPTQNRGTNTEITSEITSEITLTHSNTARAQMQPIPFIPPSVQDCRNRNGLPLLSVKQKQIAMEHFERFWKAYPKKHGRSQALNEWLTLPVNVELYNRITETVQKWRKTRRDWQYEGDRYIPKPEKFLREQLWTDEVKEWQPAFDKPMDIASMAGMIIAEGERRNADVAGYNLCVDDMERRRIDTAESRRRERISDDEPLDVTAVWTA